MTEIAGITTNGRGGFGLRFTEVGRIVRIVHRVPKCARWGCDTASACRLCIDSTSAGIWTSETVVAVSVFGICRRHGDSRCFGRLCLV